ncbi:MAG: hypothetical protein KDC95_08145 [Planctomycetes bacterium]|nr:hypothetical protein [Planctomycetota bacterium]
MMRAFGFVVSAVVLSLPVLAQSPNLRLVKDIAPGIETYHSSDPAMFTRFGNQLYFVADDGEHGPALWKTDGTKSGTMLIVDDAKNPILKPKLVSATSQFVFALTAGSYVWRTDGTPLGTKSIAYISGDPKEVCAHGNRLYFRVRSNSDSLWVSDGTSAGTQLLAEFRAQLTSLAPLPDGTILFGAGSQLPPYDIWRTDGTRAGTQLVKAACAAYWPLGEYPFRQVGKGVVFWGSDVVNGVEPWWSDGTTAGTHPIVDLNAGAGGSGVDPFSQFLVHGKYLYFRANDGTNTGLWRTDGTSSGTVFLHAGSGSLRRSAVHKDRIFFEIGSRLLESDGTPSGTRLLLSDDVRLHGVLGDKLVIEADRSGWQSLVFDTTSRTWSRYPNPVEGTWQDVTNLGSQLVFSGQAARGDRELWSSDLTKDGTRLLVEINDRVLAFGSNIESLFVHDGSLYFVADDLVHGQELWISDGTAQGTRLVLDIAGGLASSNPRCFTSFDGALTFFASTFSGNVESVDLWKTDGTASGTVRWITLPTDANPDSLTVYRDRLYFAATTQVEGREIWVSDGTQAGTKIFADFGPSKLGSYPAEFTVHNGELYFTAASPSTGGELFATDGTVAGTRLVKEIVPGKLSSAPTQLYSYRDKLFFQAFEPSTGRELWVTDGSAAGTHLVRDILPGTSGSLPHAFVRTDDGLRFVADEPIDGVELWETDGTTAGTRRVTNSVAGLGTMFLHAVRPVALGRNLFFRGIHATVAIEPFYYDGATHKTYVIAETTPGYQTGPTMTPGVLCRGTVYFAANHPTAGYELFAWDSDIASARAIGHGCPNHVLRLEATAPVLGSTMRVTGSVAGNKVGFVFLSSTRATTSAFGCPDHVGVHGAALLAAVTTPNFDLRLAVPTDPVFVGYLAKLQSWFVDLTYARVESSNGLEVELGR